LDQVKGDIEERFTRRYLYSPSEYYKLRLESGDRNAHPQSADKGAERADRRDHKPRSGKAREADEDRGR